MTPDHHISGEENGLNGHVDERLVVRAGFPVPVVVLEGTVTVAELKPEIGDSYGSEG